MCEHVSCNYQGYIINLTCYILLLDHLFGSPQQANWRRRHQSLEMTQGPPSTSAVGMCTMHFQTCQRLEHVVISLQPRAERVANSVESHAELFLTEELCEIL